MTQQALAVVAPPRTGVLALPRQAIVLEGREESRPAETRGWEWNRAVGSSRKVAEMIDQAMPDCIVSNAHGAAHAPHGASPTSAATFRLLPLSQRRQR